jgi:tetratricopeptide (TPR) repeat protein
MTKAQKTLKQLEHVNFDAEIVRESTAHLHDQVARLHALRGRYADAAASFRRAVEQYGDLYPTARLKSLYEMSNALLALRQYDDAMAACNEVCEFACCLFLLRWMCC